MPGKIILLDNITREIVKSKPDVLFVFGDNMMHQGLGGQAKEMRGEPNVIGIPTKWFPSMRKDSFFSDGDWNVHEVKSKIVKGFIIIEKHLMDGKDVILPSAGIGTGLSKLQSKAPLIYEIISESINYLKEKFRS